MTLVRRILLLAAISVTGVALLAPPAPDVEDEVVAAADRAALLEAIMQLPLEFREVVLLYYYEEMETAEVAASLGLSTGTVRSRLFRARTRLRTMLEKGGNGGE